MDREEAIKILENPPMAFDEKMWQALQMAIEALSADRPTEFLKDGTLKVNVKSGADVGRVLVWGDDGCGGLYYADDRPSGEWEDKEVFSETNDDHIVDEWQSARCSICGKYHTTPYMYYFDSFNYCPNCGAKMGGSK